MSRKLQITAALLAAWTIVSVLLSAGPARAANPPGADAPGRIVREAFEILMGAYVTPPNSADVLNGGWDGALGLLHAHGIQAVPARPAFRGDMDADWAAFAGGYLGLAQAAGGGLGPEQLDRAILDGMADAFKSAGTYYYLPQESPQLNDGEVGIRLNRDLAVVEVVPGSPAAASGVRPADRVVLIDGLPIEGSAPAEVRKRLSGAVGTSVQLTLRRQESPGTLVLSLVRAPIEQPWVSQWMLDGGVGYLRIRSFPTAEQIGPFDEAVNRLAGSSPRALVVDLRGADGGSYEMLLNVASRFIRQGPVFQQINRTGEPLTVPTIGGAWGHDVPMVVLVDGETTGTAELLAAALRENGVGRLVGTRTAGVLHDSTVFPLEDGSGLVVTTLMLRSGRGQTLDGLGLEPDEQVELDLAQLRAGHDNQLATAVERLGHGLHAATS